MDAKTVIEALGDTSAVAQLCEVTPGAVSQWKDNGAIPQARLMFLKLARPDFAWSEYRERRKDTTRGFEPSEETA